MVGNGSVPLFFDMELLGEGGVVLGGAFAPLQDLFAPPEEPFAQPEHGWEQFFMHL